MRKSFFISLFFSFLFFACHERAQIDIFQLGNIDGGTPPPIGGGIVREEGPVIEVLGGPEEGAPGGEAEVKELPRPEPAVIPPPADGDKTLTKCGVPDGGWQEGTYVLRGDIQAEADTDICFPIERSGFRITIDCKGHEIIGPKLTEDPTQLLGIGIRLYTSQNKIIQHCRIHHFKTGIVSQTTNAITFKQNYLYKNKTGILVTEHTNLSIFEQNGFCENHRNDFVCVESRNLSGRGNGLDKMGSLCRDFPKPGFSQPCHQRIPGVSGQEPQPEPAVIPPPPDDSLPDPNLGPNGNGNAPNIIIVEPEPARPVEATERAGNEENGNPPDRPVPEIPFGHIDPGICTNFFARFLGLCIDRIFVSLTLGPDTFTVGPVFFDFFKSPPEQDRVDEPVAANQTYLLHMAQDDLAHQLQAGSHSFMIRLEQPLPKESLHYFRIRNQTRSQASDHLNIRAITIRPQYGEAELGSLNVSPNAINVDLRSGMMIIFPKNDILRDKLVQHPMLTLDKMRARFQTKSTEEADYRGTVTLSLNEKCNRVSDPNCSERESLTFRGIGGSHLTTPSDGDEFSAEGGGQGSQARGFFRGSLSEHLLCPNSQMPRCDYMASEAFSWNYPKMIGYVEDPLDSGRKDAIYIMSENVGNNDIWEMDWYSIDALIPGTNNQYISICYLSGDVSLSGIESPLKCRPKYIIGVIP